MNSIRALKPGSYRAIKKYEAGRICQLCNTVLSKYNKSGICSRHKD